jgi:2-methylcitrate dehydratase PrpD
MWTLESIYFKPYCCVGTIHPAIDAVRGVISKQRLRPDDIAAIDVSYPPGLHEHVGIAQPHDLLGMQFSTAFALAIAVIKGRNTPREYTTETLHDAAVREFAARVRVMQDAALDQTLGGQFAARIRVHTHDGRCYEHAGDAKTGANALLSSAELDNKFRAQVADVVGAARCDQLLSVLRNLDSVDDMAQLPPMLVATQGTG